MSSYVYGTPSLEESNELWRRFPGDTDVSRDEYENAYESLSDHIGTIYKLYDSQVKGDVYVRGDFTGDRTQVVELYLPELISQEFVHHLQNWLRAYNYGAWRIVIPTYVDVATTIMIYPDVVRLGTEWEDDLEYAYRTIPTLMRARNTGCRYNRTPESEP